MVRLEGNVYSNDRYLITEFTIGIAHYRAALEKCQSTTIWNSKVKSRARYAWINYSFSHLNYARHIHLLVGMKITIWGGRYLKYRWKTYAGLYMSFVLPKEMIVFCELFGHVYWRRRGMIFESWCESLFLYSVWPPFSIIASDFSIDLGINKI